MRSGIDKGKQSSYNYTIHINKEETFYGKVLSKLRHAL